MKNSFTVKLSTDEENRTVGQVDITSYGFSDTTKDNRMKSITNSNLEL